MILHNYGATHFGRRYDSEIAETYRFIACQHILVLEERYSIKAFPVQDLHFNYGTVIAARVFLEFNEAYSQIGVLVSIQDFAEVICHHFVPTVEIGYLKLKDRKFGFGTEAACRFGNACIGTFKSVHVGFSQDFHRVFLSRYQAVN